jgi:3-oxoacyl-[acyl-carrier-protein] synthase II
MLCPVGNKVESAWEALKSGRSGIETLSAFDTSSFTTHFGGTIKNFDVSETMPLKDAKRMDIFMQYGIAAGAEAFADSGLDVDQLNPERAGVSVGTGIGGLRNIEETSLLIDRSGPRKISPFFVPGAICNMISGNLSIRYNLQGPNLSVTTACTTGTHNIGVAAGLIANGQADVMLAGGAEMATTPVGLGGFCAARALSTRNDDPSSASRPWDADRDGFVLSDGAGVLVLEEHDHAVARGAKIYAELVGFGMSGDAFHMTSPPEGGRGAALCMQNALQSAGLNPEDIAYVNAHGTSTLAGDIAETSAIKSVFGAHSTELAVSSTKSMIGHLLGASGAVEAIVTILSLRDQLLTPTINLDSPAEGCDLDYVPHTARDAKLSYALSNSFGFGGTNGSLIFARYS